MISDQIEKVVLSSSHGELTFDSKTGDVLGVTAYGDEDGGYLNFITKVDIEEWDNHYPGESMSGTHDILDFGFWETNPDTGEDEYSSPEWSWRKQREESLRIY